MSTQVALQLLVVGGYAVGFILLGIFGHRVSERTLDDYFVAGRSFGYAMTIGTFIATLYSAFLFLGLVGAAYGNGLSGPIPVFVGTALQALFFWVFANRFWQLGKVFGYITLGDWVAHRFQDRKYGVLISLMQLGWTFPYFALQIIGGGLAISILSQGAIPAGVGAVVITFIILVYTYLSGMRGVVWTDLISAIIFCLIPVILLLTLLTHPAGGWTGLVNQLSASRPEAFFREGALGINSVAIWATLALMFGFNILGQPQMFMRIFIARDFRTIASVGFLGFGVIAPVVGLIVAVLGTLLAAAAPGIENPANALPTFAVQAYGPILSALLLAGILGAIISTTDSVLLALSSIVERNVYEYVRPNRSSREYFNVSRIIILVSTIAGLVMALTTPFTILDLGFTTFAGYATLVIPALLGLYWKRGNKYGAWTSSLLGTGVVFYLMIIAGYGSTPVLGVHASFWGILVGIISFVLVSMVFSEETNRGRDSIFEHLESFRRRRGTAVSGTSAEESAEA